MRHIVEILKVAPAPFINVMMNLVYVSWRWYHEMDESWFIVCSTYLLSGDIFYYFVFQACKCNKDLNSYFPLTILHSLICWHTQPFLSISHSNYPLKAERNDNPMVGLILSFLCKDGFFWYLHTTTLYKEGTTFWLLTAKKVIREVAKKSWWNGDLNAKKVFEKSFSGRFPLFMTAKESCDALGVEISRRNRLVQNAKKIPGSLCTPDKRNCLHTHLKQLRRANYILQKSSPNTDIIFLEYDLLSSPWKTIKCRYVLMIVYIVKVYFTYFSKWNKKFWDKSLMLPWKATLHMVYLISLPKCK